MEAIAVILLYTIIGILHDLILGIHFVDKTVITQLMDAAITVVIYTFFSRG